MPQARVSQALSEYIGQGHKWILGGARGVDQYALEYLVAKGERVMVIVPNTIQAQPKVFRSFYERTRDAWAKHSAVLELKDSSFPYPSAYHARNRAMVDRAELVIGFPHGDGGAANTIAYAIKKGKTVRVIQSEGGTE